MDVTHLTNIAVAGNSGKPRGQTKNIGSSPAAKTQKPQPPVQKPDKVQLKIALDKVIRNTRFQYDIREELGYFVVRIIDKDTDKVIREIPSKELQTIHDHIEKVLGILYDEII